MVSVLIRDLDSGINLNIAGNVKNSGNHASYAGLGPWEMNPNQILTDPMNPATAQANEIVSARYGQSLYGQSFAAVARDGTTSIPFDRSGLRLTLPSQVSWDGVGVPGVTAGGGLATIEVPSFTGTTQGNTPFQVGAGYPLSLGYAPTAWMATTAYTSGQYVNNGQSVYTCTKAGTSGTAPGPVGTGNNISDGGVKWSYQGPSLFDDNSNSASKPANHPSLYNASDWAAASPNLLLPPANAFTYPLSDLKRLTYRYADTAENYSQTVIDRLGALGTAQSQLVGSIIDTNPSAYRTNLAHTKRLLFTTFSAGLDQPGVMPNYNTITSQSNTLQLLTGSIHASQEANTSPNTQAQFTIPSGSTISDFNAINGAQTVQNQIAQNKRSVALGPIDLNRPLADYRNLSAAPNLPTPVPLGPNNMGNVTQATTDRQNLARDIFVRLILATGAMAYIDPSTGAVTLPQAQAPTPPATATTYQLTIPPPSTAAPITVQTAEYDALRYLAQIAVNIVDYIDKDDISTPFVWNPGAGDNFASQSIITDRVVFGVEKPRLVINEAYGEITNALADASKTGMNNQQPSGPANVRFWLELLNPTATPYAGNGATNSLLGDGSVPLWYTSPAGNAYNPYSIIIISPAGIAGNYNLPNLKSNLTNPANVMGDISLPTTLANPGITVPTGSNYARFDFNYPNGPGATTTVVPNNGNYNTAGAATPGFVVLGPKLTSPTHLIEFNPTTTGGAAWTSNSMIQDSNGLPTAVTTPATYGSMGYVIPLPPDGGTSGTPPGLESYSGQATGLTEHLVLLRRLANPYLPPNDPAMSPDDPLSTQFTYNSSQPANPFITVDFMDFVPAWDAVHRGGINPTTGKADTTDRNPKPTTPGVGYDPWGAASTGTLTQRAATGKVQPYAGFANAPTPAANNPFVLQGYPQSFAISQNPSPTANTPLHTFFRHNGINTTAPIATTIVAGSTGPPAVTPSLAATGTPDTIMVPFDWYIHPDRPLMDPLELLQARSVKPHELTQFTYQPPPPPNPGGMVTPGTPIQKSAGRIPWFGFNPTTNLPGYDQTASVPLTHNGLFRALDMLRVKPWGYGEASGGRIYGRLNLNTVQDPRTMLAALDPQAGNLFNAGTVNNLWTTYMTGTLGRTVNSTARPLANGTFGPTGQWTTNVPVPGPTVDDILSGSPLPAGVTGLDRPFKAFGVAEYNSGTLAMTAGSGLQDTLLRVTPTAAAWTPNTKYTVGKQVTNTGNLYLCISGGTSAASGGPTGTGTNIIDNPGPKQVVWNYVGRPGQPLLWLPGQTNQYFQAELARKLMNNTTTVSNTFAVSMTVVFVSVRTSGGVVLTDNATIPRPLLGSEAYAVVPGDLRQQYYAVVDRSNMTLLPGLGGIQSQPFTAALSQAPTPLPNATSPTLFNLSLAGVVPGDAAPTVNPTTLALRRDGNTISIGIGTTLLVGAGSNQDMVTVKSINTNGSINVTVPAHTHYAGEVVTNAVPGYNGPQPNFDGFSNYNNGTSYGMVVPYAVRVQ